jgi:carboxyl-terminal processing protease
VSVTRDTFVKITIAHWLTPGGKQINKVGIAPDVEVKMTEDDYKNKRDPQLDKALEILQEKLK